jgi:hypothetical protein
VDQEPGCVHLIDLAVHTAQTTPHHQPTSSKYGGTMHVWDAAVIGWCNCAGIFITQPLIQAKDTKADAKSIDNLCWNGCFYPECQ